MPVFEGLGKALRWLRNKQDKRQYQLAQRAAITKAMLSAYETGKQRPSLETLEKILEALGVGLAELQDALDVVNERTSPPGRGRRPPWGWSERPAHAEIDSPSPDPAVDLYRILRVDRMLPPEEERAFREMLGGFHRLIRFLHSRAEVAGAGPLSAAPGDSSGD